VKVVSAIMGPHAFVPVQQALRTYGVLCLTVSEVLGQDGRCHREVYRGQGFVVDLQPHVRLDIVAPDDDAADLVRIIVRVAAGQAADGQVWVSPVHAIVRVRTGQRGIDAL
jgi:nitrogen regulatory protein P-II 1